MIDLWMIDLEKNKIILDCSMDERQTAQYHIWTSYRESWPEWDRYIWVGVENGEVVWLKGKRKSDLRSFSWMLRRLSVKLFQPIWV